jgi:hypothetical protein
LESSKSDTEIKIYFQVVHFGSDTKNSGMEVKEQKGRGRQQIEDMLSSPWPPCYWFWPRAKELLYICAKPGYVDPRRRLLDLNS